MFLSSLQDLFVHLLNIIVWGPIKAIMLAQLLIHAKDMLVLGHFQINYMSTCIGFVNG
jgi:hypothetical protein